MENNMQNKEKLLYYLEIIRDNQALKPPEEMNRELLEGTIDLLLKLQNKKADLTPEEIKERVRKIPFVETPDFEDAPQKTRKKINKRKILLIAAIIAILCTLLSIASIAFEWSIFDMAKEKFGSVFNVPIDEVQNENGISYENHGQSRKYDSFDEFLKFENIDVLIPSNLPPDIKIEQIHVAEIDGHMEITFIFDNCVVDYTILLECDVSEININISDESLNINNFKCYINRMEDINLIQIYFEHQGNYYKIGGSDEQILLNIIENLEEK